MKHFTKGYQLWQRNEGGYSLTEFDELEDAVLADKLTSDWYVTKAISANYDNVTFNNLIKLPKEETKPL